MNLRNIVRTVLNEIFNESSDISIEKNEPDERSNRIEARYKVNYQKTVDGELIELEGWLKPIKTGRSTEYSFEPGFFSDEESERYYNDNFEAIESEILDKFYQTI